MRNPFTFHPTLQLFRSLIVILPILFASALLPAQDIICSGGRTLTSQAEVDAFNCTKVTGGLTIRGADIQNLDGLSGLTSIGGGLIIANNPLLTNIDGLSEVPAIWELWIEWNDLLPDLDGLSSLHTIRGIMVIENNRSLAHIDGLAGLRRTDDLWIFDNPSLGSFCGLYPLFNEGSYSGLYSFYGNLVNPRRHDILNDGPCIADPVDLIDDLVADTIINSGQANSIMTKLDNCQMNAFANQVNAFVNAGKLTREEADALIEAANAQCALTKVMTSPSFALGHNYPNPASGYTLIPFTLATSRKVHLHLYDATGKLVRNIMDKHLPEGTHEIKVNLQAIPAGTYFYKVQVGEFVETLPMMVE